MNLSSIVFLFLRFSCLALTVHMQPLNQHDSVPCFLMFKPKAEKSTTQRHVCKYREDLKIYEWKWMGLYTDGVDVKWLEVESIGKMNLYDIFVC